MTVVEMLAVRQQILSFVERISRFMWELDGFDGCTRDELWVCIGVPKGRQHHLYEGVLSILLYEGVLVEAPCRRRNVDVIRQPRR